MKEWIPSRRDQTKVAWHEVPGNKRKVESVPKGRLICSLVQRYFSSNFTSCAFAIAIVVGIDRSR